jgi:hypothetical protein
VIGEMQQRVLHRLQRLEISQGKLDRSKQSDKNQLLDEIIEFLQIEGVSRGPKESVASVFARALGMSSEELLAQLEMVC